jgi:hypothetical protein
MLTGAEETKGFIIKSLAEKVDNMLANGCSNFKLHEQRMRQMEKILDELKDSMDAGFLAVKGQVTSLDNKVTLAMDALEKKSVGRFDKINNLVIGILVFTIIISFFAGINVWEIARNYMTVIKH